MIYYKMQISLNECMEGISEETRSKDYALLGTTLNHAFERMKYKEVPVVAYVSDLDDENVVVIFAKRSEDTMERVQREIKDKTEHSLNVSVTIKSVLEITVEEFRNGISDSHGNGYLRNARNVTNELKIDYENNHCFSVKEGIVADGRLSKKQALKKAKELMADEEYIKEIERIYSKENVKEFYCHPVHYHIRAGNDESAKAMTDLLLESLYSNGRLLGRRMSYVYGMTLGCYDEPDFENLICNSQGATIVLGMNTEKNKSTGISEDYQEVAAYIGKMVNLYQKNVLFVFQEVENKNSIGKTILAEIDESIRMIELEEGIGNQNQAEAMLEKIIQKSEYVKFLESDRGLGIPKQDTYTLSEIYNFYEDWVQRTIYEKAYKAYGLKEKVVVEETIESSPYEELNKMVGLKEVKSLVDQIIAMNVIQKKRQEMGLNTECGAMHMLFTGNPGSAKTSVARLITRILYEEGIIKNKKIVECGRGNLVGKYVGWTARQVKSRFREAKNGVLFIDEAYSLVDDRNGSFGDEAINTIVQEMENHRTDVIVIFAGYPKKMEAFLEKNEGLRSRIAFHVDFPDYNKEELLEILKLMIKQRGYDCETFAMERCARLFEKACLKKDFGNGRYVRNVLEHAIMKQSKRLMKEYEGMEVGERELNFLMEEDFEMPETIKESEKSSIGFRCS